MLPAVSTLFRRWPAFIAASFTALAACSSDPSAMVTESDVAGSGGKSGAPSTASGTVVTTGGSEGGGATSGESGEPAGCNDVCPAPIGGVERDCKYRFMYGVNYAWHYFGADFGGISKWNLDGVSVIPEQHAKKLADMRAHGASVIRWWVFPDFRGDGVDFDSNDNPTGLGGTAVADLQKALELAEQNDVHLMLCLFNFGNFDPSGDISGLYAPGITPIVKSDERRKMLLENVVRPVAKAVAASPYKKRLVAWDVINEPEWAMEGSSPYGDEDYGPMDGIAPVTHAEMETFVAETIGVLRQESDALITVGGAAMKWAKAWSNVDIDFYQFHIYDWINTYWPYTKSPSDYGIGDKPVVMGEFPMEGLKAAPYGEMLSTLYENGYAGALGWQYDTADATSLGDMKAFADKHPCESRY